MKRKNPKVALFLSLLLAGLGQFYNGQAAKGLFFLSAAILSLVISLSGVLKVLSNAISGGSDQSFMLGLILVLAGLLGFMLFSGLSVWEAFSTAKKLNEDKS